MLNARIVVLLVLAVAASLSAIAREGMTISPLEDALATPGVKAGLAAIDASRDDSARLLVEIGGIESPSGQEQQRAEAVARHMQDIGLSDVTVTDIWNVVGRIPGRSGQSVVFVSTLDDLATVAEHQRSASQPLRVVGDKVLGPGSNTSLTTVALMSAASALLESGLQPEHDIVFAAAAQEETGLGGMRALYRQHRQQAIAFVDVLGEGEVLAYGGIGIHWWKVTAYGSPGHTLHGGLPNVNQAIGRAVDRILMLSPPLDSNGDLARLNIAVIESGRVFNHKPASGWFSLDIRGLTEEIIGRLEAGVQRELAAIESELDVRFELEAITNTPPGQIPGARESALVRNAQAISAYLGSEPTLSNSGSSNMNIAVAGGTPAIQIGGERGGRRGFADEWASLDVLQRTARHVFLASVTLGQAIDG
ncbi:M20 family metallopeptidase [Parahaliea aestuarii]|uniref:M20/M25/M40 family metallo-hydrolase n=1 Tax=Parahaliea aestuarii TaxID=1852021 RepID=A0A5C9A4J0_9GAMM|nr:M20/M25/M40 family metallo-hydrolase [Parahaliea aestuarii]TXS94934.1 M20/M25/M40 family metallo-hydrolase [Parahaliea aestuarii]